MEKDLDNISEYFKYDELTDTKSITNDGLIRMRWYQYINKKPFWLSLYQLSIENGKYITSSCPHTKISLNIEKDNIIGIGSIGSKYNILIFKEHIESTMYLKSYFDVRKNWVDITKKIRRNLILKNLYE